MVFRVHVVLNIKFQTLKDRKKFGQLPLRRQSGANFL